MSLAAETLLVSVLAWMPLQVSVTLATVLTLVLLQWALLSMRRSIGLAWMTIAMLGMLWRGEAWKTVYLAEEAQAFQEQRLSPKTTSNRQVSLPVYAGVQHVLPRASFQFLVEPAQEDRQCYR